MPVSIVLAARPAGAQELDAGCHGHGDQGRSSNALQSPASAQATVRKVEAAYFKMVNEGGGINGRKINPIPLDDGYMPPHGWWAQVAL